MEEAKAVTEEVNTEVVSQLLRGERPKNMPYEEFKIKRSAVKKYLKNRAKGKFLYVSKEFSTIKDEEGKDKEVIKSYGPYRKDRQLPKE